MYEELDDEWLQVFALISAMLPPRRSESGWALHIYIYWTKLVAIKVNSKIFGWL